MLYIPYYYNLPFANYISCSSARMPINFRWYICNQYSILKGLYNVSAKACALREREKLRFIFNQHLFI